MPSPPDRNHSSLEIINPATPQPPLNVTCAPGFDQATVDVWWSSPAEIAVNTGFTILGVNVYRSFDSEFGPYHRMNAIPVQVNYWRDKTRVRVVLQEDVSQRFSCRGDTDPSGRWIFRTSNFPLSLQPSLGTESANMNVYVTVDGTPAHVAAIVSKTGEVELDRSPRFDVASQTESAAVLPTASSVVLASYRYIEDGPRTSLYQRLFYRVTTVAVDALGNFLETPISSATQTNTHEVEKLDWIWREAIRRNKFILEQGGERVKAFIRKSVGSRCGCYSHTNRQPASDCLVCFGTGVLGGYDGPYDIVVAPDDSEKKISQGNRGRSLEHSYETWTGPTPLLSQRDFVVKLNGDRYALGPVRMPSNRGMQLQQHFAISHIDEGDIRYKVPVLDTSTMITPQTRYMVPGMGSATPMTTEREDVPDEIELRGRTPTWENAHRR